MIKKNITTIVSIISCVLLLICLFKISFLQNQIDDLHDSMNSQFAASNNTVNQISSQVEFSLEKQLNLLALASWEYGALNLEKNEIELKCSVVPKEYELVSTEVFLVYKNAKYPMTFTDNQYTLTLNVPLFELSDISNVMLMDQGNVRNQALDWKFLPYEEFLPQFYARHEGSFSMTVEKASILYQMKGLVVMDVTNHKSNLKNASVRFVLDGKEVKESPIDLSYDGQQAYLKQSQNFHAYAMSTPQEYADNNYSQLYYFLDESINVPFGSMLETYVEIVDQHGFHYTILLNIYAIDENGHDSYEDNRYGMIGLVHKISDENGKVLFYLDESLYN